ncbi:hypothetical protein BDQ17DRAFT_1546882 [Cyathus striatus]|nr:hypothetical protein BDQ17DRAFT_1546882 [Cyathus striatus]
MLASQLASKLRKTSSQSRKLKLRKTSSQSQNSDQSPNTIIEADTDDEASSLLNIDAIVKNTMHSQIADSGLQMLATLDVAKKETNAGYRPRRGSKVNLYDDPGPMIGVSAVVCIPTGLNEDGTLVTSKAPLPKGIEELEVQGLAMKLSKPFAYADEKNLDWVLLKRDGRVLTKSPSLLANGEAFYEAKSRPKGNINDSRIFVTLSKPIPPHVYMKWIEVKDDSDENLDEDSGMKNSESGSEEEGSEWMGLGSDHDDESDLMDHDGAYDPDSSDLMDTLSTSFLPAPTPSSSYASSSISSSRNQIHGRHKDYSQRDALTHKHRRALSNRDGNMTIFKVRSKKVLKPIAGNLWKKYTEREEKENKNFTPLFLPADSDDDMVDMIESTGAIDALAEHSPKSSHTVPDEPPLDTDTFVPTSRSSIGPPLMSQDTSANAMLGAAATSFDEFEPPLFDWDELGYESSFRRKGDRLYNDHWASSYTRPTCDF